ncbi:unnamed protein product, partial [Medioppia subpectinata]
ALRPEVDNWMEYLITGDTKTIDDLKRDILTVERIDKDMDEVAVYLYDDLLSGNSSIGDVLRDKDCVELRLKSADNKLKNYSSLASCSICLNPFDSHIGGYDGGAEDRWQRTLYCSHRFHKRCIDEWLKTHRQCPLCRRTDPTRQMARRGGGHSRRPQYRTVHHKSDSKTSLASTGRMASNPTSVLVSIKTLCPEVEDYWLSIPSHVKTIDGLKRHILSDNFIVKDTNDVELYLIDGLLRGHSSIAGVLRDRDRIEMRTKCVDNCRIISSTTNTSLHNRIKSLPNECITVEDSDDGSGVQTVSTSENQLKCDRKPSIDPNISVTNRLDTKFTSALKVLNKSVFNRKTVTKRADKMIVKSESSGSNACPPVSTARISSKSVEKKTIGPEVEPQWPSRSGQTASQWW